MVFARPTASPAESSEANSTRTTPAQGDGEDVGKLQYKLPTSAISCTWAGSTPSEMRKTSEPKDAPS